MSAVRRLSVLLALLTDFPAADAYKNDPRNPYREEIAKQEAAAHH